MASYSESRRAVIDDYKTKYDRTRAKNDELRARTEAAIPEIAKIHKALSDNGLRIMDAAMKGQLDLLEEIRRENAALREKRSAILVSNGYPADYLDIKYECEKCHDSGYTDGKMCECMKRALTLAGVEASGMGHLIKKQTFDNFTLDYYGEKERPAIERNLASLKAFAESFRGNGDDSWLLVGATGLGKTHLCSAVAGKVIERGYDVCYMSASALIGVFERQRFGDGRIGDGTERPVYECDLLIIDDLGVEVTNQFSLNCLYEVINNRIVSGKSTIINTNLDSGEIRGRYNDRITSRIFGEYKPLVFLGQDIRKQKIKK